METRTITVYEYDELSDNAKETAHDNHAIAFGYSFADDAMDSLIALAKHFGGKLADWEIDWFDSSPSSAEFSMPDDLDRDEIGRLLEQLGTYDPKTLMGHGDCKLTGYCADEDAIDGFRAAFKGGEADLERLMQAAFKNWLKVAQSDCAEQYSDEYFSECCAANKYRFHANGELA